MTRRTPTQSRIQQQQIQKSNENGNSCDSDESRNNNNRYQNRFGKSSPYYNPFNSSGKNKAKRYFRHSLQRSVPMAPLSSEHFSNIYKHIYMYKYICIYIYIYVYIYKYIYTYIYIYTKEMPTLNVCVQIYINKKSTQNLLRLQIFLFFSEASLLSLLF